MNVKCAIIISGGMGDALLWVPTINLLIDKNIDTTLIIRSHFDSEQLFKILNIHKISIINIDIDTKTEAIWNAIKYFKKFDYCLLNGISGKSHSNRLTASLISDKVVSFEPCPSFHHLFCKWIQKPIDTQHHEIEHCMSLSTSLVGINDVEEYYHQTDHEQKSIDMAAPYILMQCSAGNGIDTYKIPDLAFWEQLTRKLLDFLPNEFNILLTGTQGESRFDVLIDIDKKRISSLIGKTSLKDLVEYTKNSKAYVGTDSGLMHLAFIFQKPILSFWGGSNPQLYGYAKFNKEKYISISSQPYCHPCDSWFRPNTKKVSHPNLCSDHECIKTLKIDDVQLRNFVAKIIY
ncbi:MAG: hypothetical protein KBA06_03630 [Saprospiraceae bacterium]|nr:hypothetical protein [Saprospiraceae bacterium]